MYNPHIEEQQLFKLREIIQAVSKYCHIVPHHTKRFMTDRKKEDNTLVAKMFIAGIANMYGITRANTVTMMCIEDAEYKSLLLRFDRCVLDPFDVNDYRPDVVLYAKRFRLIANELGLSGVCLYGRSKNDHFPLTLTQSHSTTSHKSYHQLCK